MSEPFLGQITVFPYTFPPNGWADCAGQLLPIRQYTALFSLLGVNYGGDGRSTFGLPDLQGRVPVNHGPAPGGSDYNIGDLSGEEAVLLSNSTMPAHSHPLNATTAHGTANTAPGHLLGSPQKGGLSNSIKGELYNTAAVDTLLVPSTLSPVGGSQPHNNLQPFLVLRYCIALQGIFPPRS
jgi:microcystin-dependent protein